MSDKPSLAPLFSQVDVTTSGSPKQSVPAGADQSDLLREVLTAQDRTNELLEEMVGLLTEFVDRYGPRLAHLNGVIQALAQLGGGSSPGPDEEHES